MDLNIAFLQLLPGKTQEENLEKGLLACRKSKEKGADIALFPEIWNIGYDINQEPETLRKLAVSVDSPFVTVFQKLAKELQMAIGITFLESYHPAPAIRSVCLICMENRCSAMRRCIPARLMWRQDLHREILFMSRLYRPPKGR